MNEIILNNLYEFWAYIGKKTNRFVENENYKTVSMVDSDWPNRVFSISVENDIFPEIIDLIQGKCLPNIITIPKSNSLENHSQAKLLLRQRNMALNLGTLKRHFPKDGNIKQVKTKEDALKFAKTASDTFGYKVDGNIIYLLSEDPSKVRIFNYFQNDECIGCGMVFFDSNNNAGIHMIGTVPNERYKGIANKITEKLLWEAKTFKAENCVLNASMMGENIYRKLGFVSYEELETYLIN